MLRLLRNVAIALLVAFATTAAVAAAWIAIGGGTLSLHGWIALSLGVLGTVALTWALMALAFKSSREGWDDRADRHPARDDDKP